MNVDSLAAAALVVMIALFAVIGILRKRGVGFTLTILGALVIGVVFGIVFKGHTSWVMPIGKIYVTTLSAIVMPLVIISILSSITSLGSAKQLRGIGARSVGWLILTNAVAIILAIGFGLIFGVGKNSYLSIAGVDAANFEGTLKSFSEVLIGFFPQNVVADIAGDKIIPVILFTALIAVSSVLAAQANRAKFAVFKQFVEALKEIIYKAVGFIIELTPYAVLALVATATSNGLSRGGMMWSLIVLLIISVVAMAIDTWGVNYVLLKVAAGLPPLKFFRKIVPAQIVAFSTQSSVGTLPVTTRVLQEDIGVSPEVAHFTAPLGTSIGMPGCAGIWPVLVAIYGIHGLGIAYSVTDYIILGVMGLFVSLGVAGVPGTATIVTASVLTAVGLPLEIMVLTIPIAAIADTARTATNVTAAAVAAAIVARREKALDEDIFFGRKVFVPAGKEQSEDAVFAPYNGEAAEAQEPPLMGGSCKI
ncbi:MAG: dicarboxylate/amino acid:cation symporter [Clostridiales Family XIII bacterium]|jgi:Na+/H+-dicarboxylate symporter|nr:dicarboxylate/amino acid:cation symporter [Clostridiales Family XIII bacterium]